MTSRKRSESCGRAPGCAGRAGWASLAAALMLCFAGLGRARAEPTWFAGKMSEVSNLAVQTNRWIVFYFQSEKALNCKRMQEETWPKLEPAVADKDFIWVKLEPGKNDSQFKYYEVMISPEIVLVDPKGRERARLRGFVEPDTLMQLLNDVYKTEKAVKSEAVVEPLVMTPDGKFMKKSEYEKAIAANSISFQKYFFYDGFDKTPGLEMLDKARYIPTVLTSIRIDPADGRFGSPGLFIGAEFSATVKTIPLNPPTAEIWLDLTKGQNDKKLSDTDLAQGKIKVTFFLRAKRMMKEPMDCVELKIVGANEDYKAKGKSYKMNLSEAESQYREKWLVTDVISVKQSKVYLRLWVDVPFQGYWIDDIRMELLPPDGTEVAGGASDERDPTKALEAVMKGDIDKNEAQTDFWFKGFDKNGDRRIQASELSQAEVASFEFLVKKTLVQMDTNKDGYVDANEWKLANK